MIDHIELLTHKLAACVAFYSDVLNPLGYTLKVDGRSKGFGDGVTLDFFLTEGDPSIPIQNQVHYAFGAPSRALVDRVYEVARLAGHTLDRAHALAPQIHAHYYASYLRDPDGRLVEVVCHLAQ
jgi:catechol 2,3-dioxygenase-like lactoylglutathione lyase family enzyme